MNYIITLNIGAKYSHAYTINLWHAVRRRLPNRAYRFICYTDRPQAVPNYIETAPVPYGYLNGWWSKLMLFQAPEIPIGSTVTFLDLDTLLGPDFEQLLATPKKGRLRILQNLAIQYGIPQPKGDDATCGSAIMTWQHGDFDHITQDFLQEERVAHRQPSKTFRGDQDYLYHNFSGAFDFFPASLVESLKWGKRPGAAATCDHGKPLPVQFLPPSQLIANGEHQKPSLDLESFRNAYEGRRAELLLTGPSLAHYKQDRSMVSFGVNSILFEDGWNLDHFLIQDRGHAGNPRSFTRSPGRYNDFVPGVAKWFGDFSFTKGQAKHALAGLVATKTGHLKMENGFGFEDPAAAAPFSFDPPFCTRNSVAFVALQMLVFMGVREIHVVGADLHGGRIGQPETVAHLTPAIKMLEEAWQQAADFCKAQGVRLVMVNPVGLRGQGFIELDTVKRKAPAISHEEHKTTPGEGMRFHLLGPPYAAIAEKYSLCAYTQKVLKWARMMAGKGYEVFHYGHPEHELPDYVQHVDTITSKDWEECGLPARGNWREVFFDAQNRELQGRYNRNTAEALARNARPKDFVLHFWSGTQEAATMANLRDVQIVEPGIGYTTTFATFKVFESHAIRNHCHGLRIAREKRDLDPWQMDTVIPNYFDPKDFEFSEGPGAHFLYLGRIIRRKGLEIVVRLAIDNPTKQFVIAGQGNLTSAIPAGLGIPSNIELAGYADTEKRRNLMRDAKACLVPTLYNEPFGGVAVEAMLSGTPVITSQNGAFAETVDDNVSGLRCWNYSEYLEALDCVDVLNRHQVRECAERYLFEAVAPQYERYFKWLHQLAHDRKNLWWTKGGTTQ